MTGLDDHEDGLNDAAFDRALRAPTRTRRATSMPPAVAALAAAARAISADVIDAAVNVLRNGSVEVILRTRESQAAAALAEQLGCTSVGWATDGRTQWLAAEIGEHGDSFVLHVTGGHRPVCQCHPNTGRPL